MSDGAATSRTVADALRRAAAKISRRDAETLLAYVMGGERAWAIAHPEAVVGAEFVARFEALVERRAAREPLQYLTGVQEFYGLAMQVSPATLIPRPETELLVEAVLLWAAEQADPDRSERTLRIADVGTGSGAIAVALATHLAGVEIAATDVSPGALAVARANAAAHACEASIRFVEADLLTGVCAPGELDAVVSNPPYVPSGDAAEMQPEVVRHEPHGALFAGMDGLDVYRRLIPAARLALRQHGLLAMEFGFGQREAIAGLLAEWEGVRFIDDYAGIPRVVLAFRR